VEVEKMKVLWHSGVIARKRDKHLILGQMQIIRQCALARPLLIYADGFIAYVQAVQLVLRSPLPSRKRGRPRLIPWPDIQIGQVVKRYQGKRVVEVTRRMAQGCLEKAMALLKRSHGGTKLNTAFIERLSATFRSRLAVLVRRSRALIRNPQSLEPLMYLMGCVYNFCTEHKSLRLKLWVGSHGFREIQIVKRFLKILGSVMPAYSLTRKSTLSATTWKSNEQPETRTGYFLDCLFVL
jgi:hypothetical protein